MGWGCYKHECDAGSEKWKAKSAELSAKEEQKGFPRWGRDEQVCPFCYEEAVEILEWIRDVKNMGPGVFIVHAKRKAREFLGEPGRNSK